MALSHLMASTIQLLPNISSLKIIPCKNEIMLQQILTPLVSIQAIDTISKHTISTLMMFLK